MTYSLEFQIGGLPRMHNASGKSKHHFVLHAEAKRWKRDVALAVGNRKPPMPLTRYTLTLVRFSSVEPDFDGATIGFKYVVDSLVDCGVLANDKISNSGQWNVAWVKSSPRNGRISVRVEEKI